MLAGLIWSRRWVLGICDHSLTTIQSGRHFSTQILFMVFRTHHLPRKKLYPGHRILMNCLGRAWKHPHINVQHSWWTKRSLWMSYTALWAQLGSYASETSLRGPLNSLVSQIDTGGYKYTLFESHIFSIFLDTTHLKCFALSFSSVSQLSLWGSPLVT